MTVSFNSIPLDAQSHLFLNFEGIELPKLATVSTRFYKLTNIRWVVEAEKLKIVITKDASPSQSICNKIAEINVTARGLFSSVPKHDNIIKQFRAFKHYVQNRSVGFFYYLDGYGELRYDNSALGRAMETKNPAIIEATIILSSVPVLFKESDETFYNPHVMPITSKESKWNALNSLNTFYTKALKDEDAVLVETLLPWTQDINEKLTQMT